MKFQHENVQKLLSYELKDVAGLLEVIRQVDGKSEMQKEYEKVNVDAFACILEFMQDAMSEITFFHEVKDAVPILLQIMRAVDYLNT